MPLTLALDLALALALTPTPTLALALALALALTSTLPLTRCPSPTPNQVPLTVGDADGGRRGGAATFTYYDPLSPPELRRATPAYATVDVADRVPQSGVITG